jgi:hypothetical protein
MLQNYVLGNKPGIPIANFLLCILWQEDIGMRSEFMGLQLYRRENRGDDTGTICSSVDGYTAGSMSDYAQDLYGFLSRSITTVL